jgi:hypothetical protein
VNAGFDKPLYILPFDHRDWKDGRIPREAAVREIALRYRRLVNIFEAARAATGVTPLLGARR